MGADMQAWISVPYSTGTCRMAQLQLGGTKEELTMRTESLIRKRFAELANKAEAVASTRHQGGFGTAVDSEAFQEWATSALSLIQRVFEKNSVHYQNFYNNYHKFQDLVYEFEDCRGIFKAAKEDYEGGYLFNVRALVKAETLVDVLDQAEVFKNANYVDTACILAGVALEIAIREIYTREGGTPGKFNSMNEELWKKGIYNQAMWEQLKTWYTRRSKPAHGNFGQSTPKDADDMINGIRRFVADYL